MSDKISPQKKTWTKSAWDQLKNISRATVLKLMEKDPNWIKKKSSGARIGFVNSNYKKPYDVVTIHYHPKNTYDRASLCMLLDNIYWDETMLRKWKVIK